MMAQVTLGILWIVGRRHHNLKGKSMGCLHGVGAR